MKPAHRSQFSPRRDLKGEKDEDTQKFKPCRRYGLLAADSDPNQLQKRLSDENGEYLDGYYASICEKSEICKNCGGRPAHIDTVVIAVDGACRGNGSLKSEASYGVFVKEESPLNTSSRIPDSEDAHPPTNQIAELWAAYFGIITAIRLKEILGKNLSLVVIKADSEYVVRGMTDWIGKWKNKGWKTVKGAPVTNRNLFEKLQTAVDFAAIVGVKIEFWHVRREFNQEADELANLAFDNSFSAQLRKRGRLHKTPSKITVLAPSCHPEKFWDLKNCRGQQFFHVSDIIANILHIFLFRKPIDPPLSLQIMGGKRHNESCGHHRPPKVPKKTIQFEPCKRYGVDSPFADNPNLMQTFPEEGFCQALCDTTVCDCGDRMVHPDTLIVAVDGACRGNGTSTAEATYGVYVNEFSKYNDFSRLPKSEAPHTNQKAELLAGYHGIMTGLRIIKDVEETLKVDDAGPGTKYLVIIKTDSEHLAKGMTEWIVKWKANGWINSRGGLVANRALFLKVQSAIDEVSNSGHDVEIWHVKRQFNQNADDMAKMAFDDDFDEDIPGNLEATLFLKSLPWTNTTLLICIELLIAESTNPELESTNPELLLGNFTSNNKLSPSKPYFCSLLPKRLLHNIMAQPAPVWNTHPSSTPNPTATKSKFEPCEVWGYYIFTDDPNLMQTWPKKGSKKYSMAICPHVKEACPCCGHLPPEQDTIIIAVDGACRDNGKATAQGAYGVFINELSRYNKSERLPQSPAPHTNQIAELWAGYHGIYTAVQFAISENLRETINKMREEDGEPEHVGEKNGKFLIAIIKTDSAYLTMAMTSWIAKWKSNGWKTSKGTRVANQELFEKVQEAVDYANREGIEVKFWYTKTLVRHSQERLRQSTFYLAWDKSMNSQWEGGELFELESEIASLYQRTCP
ncbi:hypothetical protein HYFRA_00001688 [Hymenoscyphus fraxineus]|uniref:ribonuclease H n=1 Tax=Hymenoscyphus fraxineus TaxID=746836 RepID=A0A9N9PU21_9HELO|nr:hypothetical protein HYFRA_00001688 [Hymenoscyphus fraxineus]